MDISKHIVHSCKQQKPNLADLRRKLLYKGHQDREPVLRLCNWKQQSKSCCRTSSVGTLLSLLLRTIALTVDVVGNGLQKLLSALFSLLPKNLIFMTATSIIIDNLFLLWLIIKGKQDCLGQQRTVMGFGGFRIL